MSVRLLNRRGREGFSLLEVMIAVGILGIALVVIMRGHILNLRGMQYTRSRTTAFMLAENLLVEYETAGDVAPGTESGEFEGDFEGFRWERRVEPISYEGAASEDILRVEVSVFWNEQESVSAVTFLESF